MVTDWGSFVDDWVVERMAERPHLSTAAFKMLSSGREACDLCVLDVLGVAVLKRQI